MKLYTDKYIILTGGSGFIASCFLRYLNDKGLKNCIIVDELGSSEKWKNLVRKQFVEFVPKGEIFTWLNGRQDDIEAFVHLGACSSTVETNASYLMENNTRFSIRLAEYAITHGHRFVYASSAATYGDGALGFSDDHALLEQFSPLNMYGFSKHLFDLWLKENNLLDKVVGLKYFNIFGPNEYHKGRMSSAILKMVPEALKNGEIQLFKSNEPQYKDGGQMRDFLYVKDAVAMTYKLLESDLTGIFNIGMGKAHTWNELVEAMKKALNIPIEIKYIDMPPDLIGKYQNYTRAEMGKFFTAFPGFNLSYSLETAVSDYIQNYLLPQKTW